MTRLRPISYEDEELIWCKQSIMRVMAWLSFQHDGVIDELCAMLNDISTYEKEDIEAIAHLIKAVESYKNDERKNP